MANNIVSEWLEARGRSYGVICEPQRSEEARDYAAKLDRLVEAATKAKEAIENSNACSFTGDRLADALAAIKLPEEANGGE